MTPWIVACQALLSMEFSRQEYCIGLPFPSSRDLPNPGIKHASSVSPKLAGGFFTAEPPGKSTDSCTHASTVSCLEPAYIPLGKHIVITNHAVFQIFRPKHKYVLSFRDVSVSSWEWWVTLMKCKTLPCPKKINLV